MTQNKDKMSLHTKQTFEKDKKGSLANIKDVQRKRLESRLRGKEFRRRFRKLTNDQGFIDYMYSLLVECEYFLPGEGRVNGECYEKKGKLMIATKIVEDLTFMTPDGINKIFQLRRELHGESIVNEEEE